MATTSPFLVASNTGEHIRSGGGGPSQPESGTSPAKIPVFPPEHVVKSQAFYSPIHTAIYDPKISVSDIESMILADPACLRSIHPQNGYTPLHAAVRRAHLGMIKMIVKHGADIEARANEGETPLIVACQVSGWKSLHVHVYCIYMCTHCTHMDLHVQYTYMYNVSLF